LTENIIEKHRVSKKFPLFPANSRYILPVRRAMDEQFHFRPGRI